MSNWTTYQLLIIIGFSALLILMNVFSEQVSTLFSFIDSFIEPSILIIFFSTILIIWGFSFILLFQEKKGTTPLFVHKIWRIMPAIMGVILLVSVGIFMYLGVTVLADLGQGMQWILDLLIVYFFVVFYLLVLSITIRYGKVDTDKNKIMTSANAAVLVLLVTILFIPLFM